MCETTHGLRVVLRGPQVPPPCRAPTTGVGPEKSVEAVQMPFRSSSRAPLEVEFGRWLAALEVVFELL